MSKLMRLAAASALALSTTLAAHATVTTVDQFNQWFAFDIDDLTSLSAGVEWIDLSGNIGDALSFSFELAAPAFLKVVDAGHAGDRFNVNIAGAANLALTTGAATNSFPASLGTDYDAAFADNNYSRLVVQLNLGAYTVSGNLLQAAGGGAPLNVTTGALMLTPVPEASTWALMLAGLGIIGFALRRRT